ncbi:MAG: GtrA family protein [Burkholderiales bacterium]|jgi:putative flippase GtrA
MPTLLHRFGRFAVVGALATATHALVFTIAIEAAHIEPVLATVVAFVIAMLVGYVLNRRWTFAVRDAPSRRLGRYAFAALAGLALNAGIMYCVVHLLHWSPYIGLAAAIAIVPPVTFSLNHFWVFRDAAPGA